MIFFLFFLFLVLGGCVYGAEKNAEGALMRIKCAYACQAMSEELGLKLDADRAAIIDLIHRSDEQVILAKRCEEKIKRE
jgi:hypothetical protein